MNIGEEVHQGHTLIVSATLTLLALIIGFSFSMAIGRYDQRKHYEEAEANAIGTEYVRADYLLQPQGIDRSVELTRSVRRASGFVLVGNAEKCFRSRPINPAMAQLVRLKNGTSVPQDGYASLVH